MEKKFTYGWSLVAFSALLFLLGAGITVDGLNVVGAVLAITGTFEGVYTLLLVINIIAFFIIFRMEDRVSVEEMGPEVQEA